MMGYEQSDDLHESREAMESLVLGEPFNGRAFSGGTETDHHDPLLLSSSSSSVDRQNPNPSFNTFLDPPSYAEAIFTSFDSSSNGHESPRPTSTSNPRSSDYIYITVADPQKEEELSNSLVPGGTTYFTYLITTRTNLPEYGGPGSEFSVRRRFRDVVTLADRLSESYRGFFIPLRPTRAW
ncbi:Sorting nexin 2B [Morella rubra]|uniref:Sorting nexin 2B n=1 Tax=Morella rubra TaxID=262757 RepID=A0A6A1VY70_9ROSI|nr:Sorting nexin 2B [Morella rubra]